MPKHEVYIKIEIPNGQYCNAPGEFCNYFICDDYGCFCGIFPDKDFEEDPKTYYNKRHQLCLELDKGRICINCGNFGESYCELHRIKMDVDGTCKDFVYGSWK